MKAIFIQIKALKFILYYLFSLLSLVYHMSNWRNLNFCIVVVFVCMLLFIYWILFCVAWSQYVAQACLELTMWIRLNTDSDSSPSFLSLLIARIVGKIHNTWFMKLFWSSLLLKQVFALRKSLKMMFSAHKTDWWVEKSQL